MEHIRLPQGVYSTRDLPAHLRAHPSEVHVDAALSTFIASYENGAYAADIVCPVIASEKSSDKYHKYDRKDVTTERQPLLPATGPANEADYSVSTGSFTCIDYGLCGYVRNKEVRNADDPQRPFEKRSRFLMNLLMLSREIRVATLLHATGNYAAANTSAAGNAWTDGTNGTPLKDIQTMIAAIAPGLEEQTKLVMIIALETWQSLQRHKNFVGDASMRAAASMDEIKSATGLDEIIVSTAVKNTANINQTASYSRVWDKTKAVIARVPVGEPSDEQGLFAATFRQTDDDSGSEITVRTWDAPAHGRGGSQVVQVEHTDDEVVVQNDMAYLMTGVG